MLNATTQSRSEGHLSTLKLDELIAGELDAAGERETRAHLADCPRCSARLLEIEAARASFAASPPALRPDRRAPGGVVATTARPPRRWILPAATGTLAAAAALALLFSRGAPRGGEVESPGERVKGAGHIGFYVKRGEHVKGGGAGEQLQPGDAIRFKYSSAEAQYLAILSVDGAARASVYYSNGERAAPIQPGRDVLLPQSTVLDDTLGAERIHAVFCSEAILVEPLRAALEANPAAPPIAPGCDVDTLTVEKVAKSP
jgi:hypothetical protein